MPVSARAFDAKALRRIREARGLSRDQLGKLANVPTGTITAWERAYRVPRADSLGLLSAVLACPVDDLFEPGDAAA